jgi:AraC-like DNA-binding protein/mannose-6-phosphate isomerase-like protein (cupin superfamily)
VTVSARSANPLPAPANVDLGLVDMRTGTPVRAGTFGYEADDLVTGWHHHDLHQIEYACEGIAQVETADARYLLPPQQAVWIPAGLSHNTTLLGVRSVAVFFDPTMVENVDHRVHVLAATPMLREMITYAIRWPIERAKSDATADAFFTALAHLIRDWIEHDAPLCLPTSADPIIQNVIFHTEANLAEATSRSIARAVGISERTLRRQFPAATGMSWQRYLQTSRVMRSMILLAQPRRTVIDAALEVGYQSVSAFTRSFFRLTGERPSDYRERATQET